MSADPDPYASYRSVVTNSLVRSAWADAYGDHFWTDSEPPWSQATRDDVAFVLERVGANAASVLADFGCGSGCFGRHAAKVAGARVEGIDLNPLAVRLAEERTAGQAMASSVSFAVGDICKTGWPSGRFDGAASFDVLLFVPDKGAAFREIARVLKPGARFAGTTFELNADSPSLFAPAFKDYPATFEAAGFTVELYEESENWRALLEDAIGNLIAHEAEVRAQLHPATSARFFTWAHRRPGELNDSRRVRFCVRR